ncbi:MAG: DUF4007 family protein [Sphingobacteriales bacterium]|nr:DUF4007 family protein [Sphingobacteriales bacterium]
MAYFCGMISKLSFSGHETFYCRHFWLKKGDDYVAANQSFNDDSALVYLGVGKNMVSSIRYWMRAFGLIMFNTETKRDELTELAHFIFADNIGVDPYLENIGTLWLLHYQIVTQQKASIYGLLFNEFRKERVDFTREQVTDFVKRKCNEQNTIFNIETVKKDFDVLVRNYVRPIVKSKNIEEDFSALLIDLGLLREIEKPIDDVPDKERKRWFKLNATTRENLPLEILLFAILDNPKYASENVQSVSFISLLNDENSVGLVFALTTTGLIDKLEQMQQQFKNFLTYSDDAGVRELQFKVKPNKWDILQQYYAK